MRDAPALLAGRVTFAEEDLMSKKQRKGQVDRAAESDQSKESAGAASAEEEQEKAATATKAGSPPEASEPDPPRTTTGKWFTAPKFGSAGSGGAEYEPGPERD